VAWILAREHVCDTEVAARLDCAPGFVARVRSDLRMPSFPIPEPTVRLARPLQKRERDEFEALSIVTAEGHREWLGRRSRDGIPMFSREESAYRVAWRLEYGEEPEGPVRVECVLATCVEGLHLSDRIMRERAREAE
jgi:hypothetical protein